VVGIFCVKRKHGGGFEKSLPPFAGSSPELPRGPTLLKGAIPAAASDVIGITVNSPNTITIASRADKSLLDFLCIIFFFFKFDERRG